MINADKKDRWPEDIERSVDLYNNWFLRFAPEAFRDTRSRTAAPVEAALKVTEGLNKMTPEVLKEHPQILPTLRMCTVPPIARERLAGLAGVSLNLIKTLEGGSLPARMKPADLDTNLGKILSVLRTMHDDDLFPWVNAGRTPDEGELHRTATVIADRLCGSIADPIIRNAQEERQLEEIANYLKAKGYVEKRPTGSLEDMEPGTFAFRVNVLVTTAGDTVNISVDAVIQPKVLRPAGLPIMIEAKSAGDFTNVNKRRKEEGQKGRQLRDEFGDRLTYLLFLCGYFGKKYLQYEADENFDWIWEHRISDFDQLGL